MVLYLIDFLCYCTAPRRTKETTRPRPSTHNSINKITKYITSQAKTHSDPGRLLQRLRRNKLMTLNLEYCKTRPLVSTNTNTGPGPSLGPPRNSSIGPTHKGDSNN